MVLGERVREAAVENERAWILVEERSERVSRVRWREGVRLERIG